ncbi:MAG: hypothetical protein ABWY27_17495 [Telluria sp.]
MKKIVPLKHWAILAILVGVANLANAGANANSARKVAGVYNLEGVREMAATLILHPDNRFEYGAIYGGADPRANGKWSVEDEIVHLVSDPRAPKYTKVEQDSEPLPDTADSNGILPTMGVVIASPSLGMRWGDVKVIFKFANGRTRDGMTNRSGMVFAGARPEPEWKNVPITEVGLPSPEGKNQIFWIEVSDPKITRIAVEFDPGAAAQAFREGFLEIEEGKPRRLVAGRILGELRGTYVWKRDVKAGANP